MQPGLADTTTGRSGPARRSAAALRSRMLGRELGLQRRVRAARAAAQAVVVGLGERVRRAEHGSHRAVRALHVAQVARVLHDEGRRRCRASGERALLGDPLGEVAHPGAERLGFGGAEQPAVVLHRRAAPGAVDDDRARRRASMRSPAGPAVAPRARGRRAGAARRSSRRPRPGRATWAPAARITRTVDRWVSRSHASITQPVKHHAVGVAAASAASSGVASDRADSRGSPNRRGSEPAPLRDPREPRGARSAAAWTGSSNPVRDPLRGAPQP